MVEDSHTDFCSACLQKINIIAFCADVQSIKGVNMSTSLTFK